MNRRDLLGSVAAVVAGGLAGCTSQSSADTPDDEATPTTIPADATPADTPRSDSTPEDATPGDATSTITPEPFPYSCPEAPDIEGLPSLPESPTEDSIRAFAVEFERVYAVATNDDYAGIDSIQVKSVDSLEGRFQVKLAVEAALSTPDSDGETPTPRPAEASAHRALYRIQGKAVVRELRGFPAGRKIDSECWALESGG